MEWFEKNRQAGHNVSRFQRSISVIFFCKIVRILTPHDLDDVRYHVTSPVRMSNVDHAGSTCVTIKQYGHVKCSVISCDPLVIDLRSSTTKVIVKFGHVLCHVNSWNAVSDCNIIML